jgi:hypothetical protein
MTTACTNCGRYVALTPTDQPNVFAAHDFEADRYTPSSRRHACGEIDRSVYGSAGWTR